jgi:H+-transporting ATPase
VALTMDIMFLVVLSTIFLGFTPLTPVTIIVLSLLDDVPIMTIAYDHTPIAPEPIRWRMSRILSLSTSLGFLSIVQSVAFLLFGWRVLSTPELQPMFGITTQEQLQTAVFLQITTGGHLLLFVARSASWFFRRPFPAIQLAGAIVATQILAMVFAYFGWLVPAVPIQTIVLVLVYDIVWLFIVGAGRIAAEHVLDDRMADRQASVALVTAPLQANVPPAA